MFGAERSGVNAEVNSTRILQVFEKHIQVGCPVAWAAPADDANGLVEALDNGTGLATAP